MASQWKVWKFQNRIDSRHRLRQACSALTGFGRTNTYTNAIHIDWYWLIYPIGIKYGTIHHIALAINPFFGEWLLIPSWGWGGGRCRRRAGVPGTGAAGARGGRQCDVCNMPRQRLYSSREILRILMIKGMGHPFIMSEKIKNRTDSNRISP